MKNIITLSFLLFTFSLFSQELMIIGEDGEQADTWEKIDTTTKKKTTVNQVEETLFVAEEMPKFPGGDKALMQFLGNNIIYPKEAAERGEKGVVVVRFIVNKQGEVVTPVIMKSVTPLLDSAAIDVIRLLPNFTPGQQAGKKVEVYYMLPIRFALSSKRKQKRFRQKN